MTVFSQNLKRLRLAKKLTQEQAAEALGVSAQSVSRWECGSTLPDVTMLPAIARLYCVSIDDLYQETSVAYGNYAQRLASIYRSTWAPEDFSRADQEFRRLRKNGSVTTEDLRLYGIMHQYMMRYCMTKAEELFDEVISKGTYADADTYWRTRRQKLYFLTLIGKGQESISIQRRFIDNGCDELQEWVCLIAAYQYAGDYSHAYEWFQNAVSKFPDAAILYVYGGDICKELGRTEEAFHHWDNALALDPTFCDAKHSKAFYYEELGEFAKAYSLWCSIAETLEKDGFDIEAGLNRERAQHCKEKM